MAVVTAITHQPLPTAPDDTRASQVLHDVTDYLGSNTLLVHNVKSATMEHSAPLPLLRPGAPPMTPLGTATYFQIQQTASTDEATLPLNLVNQLMRTLVIACIAELSTQALAYFLQAVLNAAIGFQALLLTHPKQMLPEAVTTVQRAWAIHGHRPVSIPEGG